MARKKQINSNGIQVFDITNFYNIANELVITYCDDRGIDCYKLEPLKWNGILLYIYDNTIKLDKTILKNPLYTNVYNMDWVIELYNIYNY